MANARVTARVRFPGESLTFGEPVGVLVAETHDEVVGVLGQAEEHARAGGYAVGFVAYDAAPAFDPVLSARPGWPGPLAWFALHDHPLAPADDGAATDPAAADAWACSAWTADTDEPAYRAGVSAARAEIARGRTYQVNYTMELAARFAGDPVALWRRLLPTAGDAYAAYLDLGDQVVLSLSPELFVDWDPPTVTARPMKGTRTRSADPRADRDLATELAGSTKDRAENLMIVDLMRNDLARVCTPGSVRVDDLFTVSRYPTVWQLTSTVRGLARPATGLVDLFTAAFPCGSVTGAPKPSTMRIIAGLERRPRGVYCGAVGLIRPGGSATFNVAIRTLVVDRSAGRVSFGAGGGVVWDSTPADEHAEALAKTRMLAVTQRPVTLVETMAYDGERVRLLDRHLDRMGSSAGWLGRAWDRSAAARMVTEVTGPPSRIRLLLGPDGALSVETTPLAEIPAPVPTSSSGETPPPAAWPVGLARTPVRAGDPWLRHKITDRRRYALHRAERPDVREVLLWNESGELTEFTIGNLVVEVDGRRWTPPLSSGLLPGVQRAELLATGAVGERVLTRTDLDRAGSVWLVNAVRGWVPVHLVDPVVPPPAPAGSADEPDPSPA